jgi:hypothetical protein
MQLSYFIPWQLWVCIWEFDSRGEHFEEHIGCRGEGECSVKEELDKKRFLEGV